MLVAVLSDTHDDLAMTVTVVDLAIERGAEAIVHCGDLATREIVWACSRLPAYFVFGNHDADSVPDLIEAAHEHEVTCLGWGGVIQLAGKKIGVAHGHMTSDIRSVLAEEPDYLLTGHTHEPADWCQGSVRRICPGALFRAEPTTFALLDLAKGQVEFISMSDDHSPHPLR